jgi:UDP-N-acetylglucosamine acyltransferase
MDAAMPNVPTPRIHPTAVISPEAVLADDVVVGPYAVLEGPVRLGPGCVVRPHATLIGPLTMGAGNSVFSGAVIGERPQHLRYKDEPTGVEVGDHNIFREGVTVHRGTTHSWTTRIGSHNFFMANSHVAHDCVIGNHCMLANGALLAGHCTVADNVFLSGNVGVHQFTRIGRLTMLSGGATISVDLPPFSICAFRNCIIGVNVIGLRRAGMKGPQIDAVRTAFRLLFRRTLAFKDAVARVEQELGGEDVVAELLAFVRQAGRGLPTLREDKHAEAA